MSSLLRQTIHQFHDKRISLLLRQIFNLVTPTGLDTGLTAHSGGTQAAGLALNPNASFHEVTVVAAAADSILLPPARVGQYHYVKNSAANAMQVYGSGTDTIDSVATATGISQGAGEGELYFCLVNGNYTRLRGAGNSESFVNLVLTGLLTKSFSDAKTAATTQTQAGGLTGTAAITTALARFATVANTNDAATLPASAAGQSFVVINDGLKTMQVFPNAGGTTTETIGSLAANAAMLLPPGGVVEFHCTVAGQWDTIYSNPTASLPFSQRTSIASGNGTLTGAQVAGAQLVTLLTSGATAQTTPTAAAMLAAIPGGRIGMQWRLRVVNSNGGTLTLTADASVTATGTLTLATNTWREFDMQITGAATATMQQVGTGTTS